MFVILDRETLMDWPYLVDEQRTYDVSRDGRFLAIKPHAAPEPEIVVVLNWHSELLARVPVP